MLGASLIFLIGDCDSESGIPSLGLESVDHYPILVAVTGILVQLLVDTDFQG